MKKLFLSISLVTLAHGPLNAMNEEKVLKIMSREDHSLDSQLDHLCDPCVKNAWLGLQAVGSFLKTLPHDIKMLQRALGAQEPKTKND